MKAETMTNTEYLLRTVRESERMDGWQDTFSELKKEISKEFLINNPETEKESSEAEDTFEM